MPRRTAAFLLLVGLLADAGPALDAHHSFAVFFDESRTLTITGAVTEFRFTNPHGIITLAVTGPDGKVETWRAETNAPVLLRRRGWTPQSLKAGEIVTIEGWAARNGSNYLRMRTVTRQDGTPVGAPLASATEAQQ